jgi:hypothetical protein
MLSFTGSQPQVVFCTQKVCMNRIAKRMWGSDVLAGLYVLAALVMLGMAYQSDGVFRVFILCGIAYFVIASVGLFFRINAIRVGVIWLLGFSILGDVLFSMFLIALLAGWLPTPPKADPAKNLRQSISRGITMACIVFYLLGDDVRAEYVRNRKEETPDDDEPWEDAESEQQ